MDEKQAILCMKRGNIGGLEVLVSLYQVRAVRAAYLITHDIALAEDVAQEAFLQAYRSIQHFDHTRPFGPWFMKSVINASVKAAQKHSRRESTNLPDQNLEGLFSDNMTVEDQVETIEIQNRVWAALQALTPRERAVVVQRYFLEMSEKEMAADLNTAPGTVKWLLHVARERLRSLLSERTPK